MHSKNIKKAIGVFDSGVGGLSVLKHIHALMPNESLIYVADSLFAPYGDKSREVIQSRCFAIADQLIAQEVKTLVVACNTATAAAVEALRERYSLPIIGMEPAVKPAVSATRNGKVGVLATTGTLKSAQFAALLENYGQSVEVYTQACEGLVECVERGEIDHASTYQLILRYCTPLIKAGVDTVVLGCTHYPFLKAIIKQILGHDVVVIDTGEAVAKQLQRKLLEEALAAPAVADQVVEEKYEKNTTQILFLTNSKDARAGLVLQQLWGGEAVEIKQISFNV
jgi:glutamate racemase